MQLKADVHALLVEGIQYRPPAGCQRLERLLKTLLVVRRPRIEKGQASEPEKVACAFSPNRAEATAACFSFSVAHA